MLQATRVQRTILRFWTAIHVDCRCLATASKKRFAVNLRHKEGRQLALEHFDFYYKPIFRQQWPSIRLGLTSRSKKCVIVNNFGGEPSTYCDQFTADGALDLITLLEEAKAQRLENEENQNQDQRKRRWQRRGSTKTPETSAVQEREGDNETNVEQEDTRSAATLNQFVMPTKYITYDTVPKSHREDDTATSAPVLDTWNRQDVQFLCDEDVEYPKHLRAFVYPIGDIRKFEDSVVDESTSVKSYSITDASSLFPVLALDVRPEETVLDLCSAPGVKALALLQTLIPCNLVCNDIAPPRINLLRHNFYVYIQQGDDVSDRIRFQRMSASQISNDNIGAYDKVLADVPNTEDRKNLRLRDDEDNLFRRSMITERLHLPDQQTEILMGGLKALRRGGSLVYTTSTLSPTQNDEVVEMALRRLKQDPDFNELEFAVFDLESMARDFAAAKVFRFARRQCRYGQLVIPYLPNNYGPVYTCKLRRVD